MTYNEAVEYILNIPRFTKKNKLDNTRLFLQYLGEPQKERKVIHVAGTNGKGSVCTYLNTMLLAQKKTVGLFTSPHLIKINERIMINGLQISDKKFLQIFEETLVIVKKMEKEGVSHPTFFEFLFGMAMLAFSTTDVEYIVLETGLGGRLDATNSIEKPLVSVITSIGMDHTSILGDTIDKIAFEKAGIIKRGVPVFFYDSGNVSNCIIEERAAKVGTSCKKIGKDAYEILGIRDKHIAFSCVNAYYGNTTWSLYNIGIYQPGNAVLAIEVMYSIFGEAGRINAWRDTLSKVIWEGRMEEVLPGVYIDGAHNVSAVECFVQSVVDYQEKNVILFSAVQDKDYEEMISVLCGNLKTEVYIITLIDDERAARLEELQRIFLKYTDRPVIVIASLKDAFSYALKNQKGRKIYCLGSLYLTGMIKSFVAKTNNR